jgi:hypothetical protein
MCKKSRRTCRAILKHELHFSFEYQHENIPQILMQTIPLNVKGFPNCNIDLEAISISDFYEVVICATSQFAYWDFFCPRSHLCKQQCSTQPLLEQNTHRCTHKYVVNLAALGKNYDKRKKTFCDRCRHLIMNSNPSDSIR